MRTLNSTQAIQDDLKKGIKGVKSFIKHHNKNPRMAEAELREFSRNSLNCTLDILKHIENLNDIRKEGKGFLKVLLPRTAKSANNDISFLLGQKDLPYGLKVNSISSNEFTVSNALIFYTLNFDNEGMLETVSNSSTSPFPARDIYQSFTYMLKHAEKANEAQKAKEAKTQTEVNEAEVNEVKTEAEVKKHKRKKKAFKTKLKGKALNEVWTDQNN